MSCFNCGSIEIENILSNQAKCKKCDNPVYVMHYSCKECNSAWVTFNDVFIMGVVSNENTAMTHKKFDKTKCTMTETVHKCLKCNKPAYEVSNNIFKCSDNECGFEWEVKVGGKGLL